MDRIVVDTNVFVSAIVLPHSIPRQAVDKALDDGVLLFSECTISELAEILSCPKFDHYVSAEDRMLFLGRLGSAAEFVPSIHLVRECRDAQDDKFLEVALNGRANLILSGDADLLGMHPWRGIMILSSADYLRR